MAEKITFDARKYKRLNLTEPLSVCIKTSNIKLSSDKEIEGAIGNISAGGAMLVSPIFIPRGATVEIEISPFDSLPMPLTTNSRVVHHEKPRTPLLVFLSLKTTSRVVHTQAKITSSKRDEDEHLYYMGVEFLNLPDETRSAINEWVEASTQKSEDRG
jgi:c-di-GMP-binding flagellar brake protein YcgR